jgi:hypothetical protein
MKRDVSIIPLNEKESLVIAADNSGGIGLKELDLVKTPYEVVSYYGFRVSVMECMAAGGKPISIVIHNFCHDDAWNSIISGIEKGLEELGLRDTVAITGSTESNFTLLQSAIGLIVIGKRENSYTEEIVSFKNRKLAVIGSPLVGNEVLELEKDVIPLSLFYELCQLDHVMIVPIGSKGILYEVRNMLDDPSIVADSLICDVDVIKTAGPATCILIAFKAELEPLLQQKCGHFYHSINRC